MLNNSAYKQNLLFNLIDSKKSTETPKSFFVDNFNDDDLFARFNNYSINKYIEDLKTLGLREVWDLICKYCLQTKNADTFLNINNFCELYEIGLAATDKNKKKKCGQYYTPKDVALVLSKWFFEIDGENICDVGCGTGELILAFLNLIGYESARELLKAGKVYLYDSDEIALNICKTSISLLYGLDVFDCIHTFHCDFLNKNICLPENSKVIANPPYSAFTEIDDSWDKTNIVLNTKELYSSFMEKIFSQSKSAVVITPYSFISGNKFYSLRKLMSDKGNGFIVSFDNVPGNIFCGHKHGVFNTNISNSVRAAITVYKRDEDNKGFRLSPLIRFKSTERGTLLDNAVLESFLSEKSQIVNSEFSMFRKIDKRLEQVFDDWARKSKQCLYDLTDDNGDLLLFIPNTCRYFTTASNKQLNRSGQIVLRFSDIHKFNFAFCLVNSSFAYWHWRIYDGGITYTKGLLEKMPVMYDTLTAKDIEFFDIVANEMMCNSEKFIVTKNNVGLQENIKFPRKYRDKINRKILDVLQIDIDESIFDIVHSNTALEVNIV